MKKTGMKGITSVAQQFAAKQAQDAMTPPTATNTVSTEGALVTPNTEQVAGAPGDSSSVKRRRTGGLASQLGINT